jgi:hypothetical protein
MFGKKLVEKFIEIFNFRIFLGIIRWKILLITVLHQLMVTSIENPIFGRFLDLLKIQPIRKEI